MTAASPAAVPLFRLVPALGVVQIFAWGSSFYLLAVLAQPIAADTGWPLPWVVGALSIGMLVAGLISPAVSTRIARSGGRSVLAAGCLLMALGQVLIGLATSLPVFIGGWVVIGLGMGACLYDAAFAALGRLFGLAARPVITRLTLWGGFASTLCWPVSSFLEHQLGWRGTCFAYAAIMGLLCVPLVLFALPAPAPPATGSAGDTPGRTSAPLRLTGIDQLKFILLASTITLCGATSAAISQHLLTVLQSQGLTLAQAVSIAMLLGPAQVASRLLEMAGGGRHHPLWTLGIAVVMMSLGLTLLALGFAWPGLALVFYGLGTGVYSIARGTVPLAVFGPERYAPVIGRIARPNLILQALAPSGAAFLLTRFGAAAMLDVLVAAMIVSLAVLAGLAVLERRA